MSLALVVVVLAVGGCGEGASDLDLDAVEAGLSEALASHNVRSVICVRKDNDEAECTAKMTAAERVVDVRCDEGSCVWAVRLSANSSEGGGFTLDGR